MAADKYQQTPRLPTDPGSVLLAVRQDSPTDTAGAVGNYGPLSMDSLGRLWVTSGGGGGGGGAAFGDVAHDDPDTGNPVKIGAKAIDPDSPPLQVAVNDRTNLYSDVLGRQIVVSLPLQLSGRYIKGQPTNSTGMVFPPTLPTSVEPTASSTRTVITTRNLSGAQFTFHGEGANDTLFDYRIVGWQRGTALWVPTIICQGTATLSNVIGVGALEVSATERFADTLDVDFGIGIAVSAPSDACVARLEIDIGPHDYLEVVYRMVTASSGNCLFTLY